MKKLYFYNAKPITILDIKRNPSVPLIFFNYLNILNFYSKKINFFYKNIKIYVKIYVHNINKYKG